MPRAASLPVQREQYLQLPIVKPANWAGAEAVAKSNDTLDVWIDSGSSSRAVIARREEIRGKDKAFQADVYLEGSDQHRGWFHSSLLTGCALDGRAPYEALLTHGFVVDGAEFVEDGIPHVPMLRGAAPILTEKP